jgi:hypothetical protein
MKDEVPASPPGPRSQADDARPRKIGVIVDLAARRASWEPWRVHHAQHRVRTRRPWGHAQRFPGDVGNGTRTEARPRAMGNSFRNPGAPGAAPRPAIQLYLMRDRVNLPLAGRRRERARHSRARRVCSSAARSAAAATRSAKNRRFNAGRPAAHRWRGGGAWFKRSRIGLSERRASVRCGHPGAICTLSQKTRMASCRISIPLPFPTARAGSCLVGRVPCHPLAGAILARIRHHRSPPRPRSRTSFRMTTRPHPGPATAPPGG